MIHVRRSELRPNQLEVDIAVYPSQVVEVVELTITRDQVRELGMEWADFVKAIQFLVTELNVKEESNRLVLTKTF